MQFKEYLTRAEELKGMLNDQPVTATPAAAQKARGKPNGGGDGAGGDVRTPAITSQSCHLFLLLSCSLPVVPDASCSV